MELRDTELTRIKARDLAAGAAEVGGFLEFALSNWLSKSAALEAGTLPNSPLKTSLDHLQQASGLEVGLKLWGFVRGRLNAFAFINSVYLLDPLMFAITESAAYVAEQVEESSAAGREVDRDQLIRGVGRIFADNSDGVFGATVARDDVVAWLGESTDVVALVQSAVGFLFFHEIGHANLEHSLFRDDMCAPGSRCGHHWGESGQCVQAGEFVGVPCDTSAACAAGGFPDARCDDRRFCKDPDGDPKDLQVRITREGDAHATTLTAAQWSFLPDATYGCLQFAEGFEPGPEDAVEIGYLSSMAP